MHGVKRRTAGAMMALLVIAGSLVVGGTAAQAITGGKAVPTDSYPYAAQMTRHTIVWDGIKSYTFDGVCDGTLIGPDWVLTAAHCMFTGGPKYKGGVSEQRLAPKDISVSVGYEKADWQRTYIPVKRIEVNPKYPVHGNTDTVLPADFALVQLARPAGQPSLRLAASEPPVGTPLEVTGWGCGKDCIVGSPNLNATTMTVISDKACPSLVDGVSNYYRTLDFCASSKLTGGVAMTEFGDSGGGIYKKYSDGHLRLSGVVAGGGGNGADAFGSVATVLPWIHQITGIGAPPEPAPIAGDLSGDGKVDCADVSILQDAFGTPYPHPADLNHDGKVDIFDVSLLMSHWTGPNNGTC